MSVIEARGLTHHYGRRVGIDGVDLAVGEGEIFGFLGPNGAGKSTTIRVLLGFLRAKAGRATVLGRDCWRDSARIKTDVGYVPGDLRLYPRLDGRSGLRMVGRIRGRDLLSRGAAFAERFELDLSVRVRQMSRGMRQKLGLILALAHDPALLVLDEPTSGLDPLMQQVLAEILRERARAGATVFFSSHTLSEVEQLCDRVAIVRRGAIVADEPLDALRRRAHRAVEIRFRDEAAVPRDVPDFLTGTARRGALLTGDLVGPAGPLVEWLAGRGALDVAVRPPDLDELFRRHYQDDVGQDDDVEARP